MPPKDYPTKHSKLLGLDKDDHRQYLHRYKSRPMRTDLDMFDKIIKVSKIEESIAGAGIEILNALVFNDLDLQGTLTVDTINEHTAAAGVTIDGVLLKDNGIDMSGILKTDTIEPHTAAGDININNVLISNAGGMTLAFDLDMGGSDITNVKDISCFDIVADNITADASTFGDGGITDYFAIASDGSVTLHGAARVVKSIGALAKAFDLTLAPAASIGRITNTPVVFYDDTAAEKAQIAFPVPRDIDTSVNPYLRIFVAPRVAQTAGSDFKIQVVMRYIGNGEALNKAADETLTSTFTVSNTATILTYTDITLDGTLIAASDHISISLARDPTVANNRNGDMAIPSLWFKYTSNKIGGD
jgi:hypothetical protein